VLQSIGLTGSIDQRWQQLKGALAALDGRTIVDTAASAKKALAA
jgi:hypothetical protein